MSSMAKERCLEPVLEPGNAFHRIKAPARFLLISDHVDAELGKPGHCVSYLLGRNVVGRQDGIKFVIGDEAALLTLLQKFFNWGVKGYRVVPLRVLPV